MDMSKKHLLFAAVIFLVVASVLTVGIALAMDPCCTETGCEEECCMSEENCTTGGCASGHHFGQCICDGEIKTVDCRV